MGLLKVNGTIDVGQFWPLGSSDADTTKVVLKVGANAFRYQAHPGAPFVVTKVFAGAKVRGSVSKPPVDAQNRLTIRLQGIDAPELHYRPDNRSVTNATRAKFQAVNKDYRQYLGESATAALARLLQSAGSKILPCTVETQVDAPGDVFDTYGRLVGDVIVRIGRKNLNINEWLVREGWAFPTFYSSMSEAEIKTFVNAATIGRTKGRIWNQLRRKVPAFNAKLVFRKGGPIAADADLGPLTLPKIFRRQTSWWAYKQAGVTTKSFKSYLAQKRDELLLTKDFLANGVHSAKTHYLDEFMEIDGAYTLRPEEMVFKEGTSALVDSSGKKITTW